MTSQRVEVQIFGVRKSADTRKAQRFFSERRVRAHFVDLMEKPIADGELRRFVQKFGINALIDTSSRRFSELGLQHSSLNSTRWLERLALEPLIMRLPLVRKLGSPGDVTIGPAEEVWRGWIS
jgi:arsenate reductase-like glutaredoxin family protein